MTFDPHAYTIAIKKIVRDGETVFKATVAELPNLATYEDTAEEAYSSIVEDISALHEMATKHGHAFPEPLQERHIEATGRVTLRLPRTLHQRLTEQSIEEDVSLNTYIISLLSEAGTANAISSKLAASVRTQMRAALATSQLIHDAGTGKTTAAYSSTAEISVIERDESWTKLH